MNKARKNAAKGLVQRGLTPKQAYEAVKQDPEFAHAFWVNGALIKKSKLEKTNE